MTSLLRCDADWTRVTTVDSQDQLRSELQAEFAAVLTELGFDPATCPLPSVEDFERVLDKHLRHKIANASVTADGGE